MSDDGDDEALDPLDTPARCPPVYTVDGRLFFSRHEYDEYPSLSMDLVCIVEEIRRYLDIGTTNSVEVLSNVIDPDAMDGIFRPVLYRTDREEGFVQFPIDEFHIRVYADGRIIVDASGGFEVEEFPSDY